MKYFQNLWWKLEGFQVLDKNFLFCTEDACLFLSNTYKSTIFSLEMVRTEMFEHTKGDTSVIQPVHFGLRNPHSSQNAPEWLKIQGDVNS